MSGAGNHRYVMSELSIDYERLASSLGAWPDPTALGAALHDALAARYLSSHPASALHEFRQSGATYLLILPARPGCRRRTGPSRAWTITAAAVGTRDKTYQRGFPLAPRTDGSPVDRGHVVPHLSGGEFGPNIFRQDRALNRGWSEQGKRYRALEREAAATHGCFFFAHLIYTDDTAEPSQIETGVLRGAVLHVERFDNRPING